MKSILILGTGRSGKTTLTRNLRDELPNYDLIHADALRFAIMNLPQKFPKEILNYEANDHYSKLLLDYIIENNRQNQQTNSAIILDGGRLLPSYLDKFAANQFLVYFLGFGNLSESEIFDQIRKNDTATDWTAELSDHDLRAKIAYFRNLDQKIQQECQIYHYNYIDTSKNRQQKLDLLKTEIISTAKS